jgi:hypothetical protein
MRREQWSRHTIASCASKQADRSASLGTKAHRRHRTNAPRVPKASLERRRKRFFTWIVHSGLAISMRQTARDRRGFLCAMAAVACQAPDRSRGTRQGWRFFASLKEPRTEAKKSHPGIVSNASPRYPVSRLPPEERSRRCNGTNG